MRRQDGISSVPEHELAVGIEVGHIIIVRIPDGQPGSQIPTHLKTRFPVGRSKSRPPGPLSILSLCDMHMMIRSISPQTACTASSTFDHMAAMTCREDEDCMPSIPA